jgi:uncharacterized protein
MKFSLFRKHIEETDTQKPAQSAEQPKQETSIAPQELAVEPQPASEVAPEPSLITDDSAQTTKDSAQEPKQEISEEVITKTYLKAMPLKDLSDVENVENEIKKGNIIILRVTPLANKSIEDVKTAVNQLYEFAESVDGDIARLGEERVVICPKNIRIWREKSPVSTDSLPTAAPTAA